MIPGSVYTGTGFATACRTVKMAQMRHIGETAKVMVLNIIAQLCKVTAFEVGIILIREGMEFSAKASFRITSGPPSHRLRQWKTKKCL